MKEVDGFIYRMNKVPQYFFRLASKIQYPFLRANMSAHFTHVEQKMDPYPLRLYSHIWGQTKKICF